MRRWVLLGALVLVVDQAVKHVVTAALDLGERVAVLPVLAIVRWHNEGAAFSILSQAGGWQRWFFVVLGFGFCGYLLYELRRYQAAIVGLL